MKYLLTFCLTISGLYSCASKAETRLTSRTEFTLEMPNAEVQVVIKADGLETLATLKQVILERFTRKSRALIAPPRDANEGVHTSGTPEFTWQSRGFKWIGEL